MRIKSICLLVSVVIFVASSALAQNQQLAAVPRLVQFSGTVKDSAGKPASGNVTLTFALYEDQEGGAALWLESQDVQVDAKGHYTVLLGAATGGGLPLDVFVSGAARWLGVQPGLPGVAERPRVLLVGVPYALKASDADTLGGKPASAYLLAGTTTQTASTASTSNIFIAAGSSTAPSSGAVQGQDALSLAALPVNPCKFNGVQGSGVNGFIPFWTGTANNCTTYLGESNIFQASNGNVGIGNTSPAGPLDLTGNAFIRGTLQLTSLGAATSTGGFNSNTLDFLTSSFKTGGAAVNQLFRWQAEPVGNNTSAPSGKFNLLFGSGTGAPAETGLSIASTGIIGFANTQPFGIVNPGTGLKDGGTVAFGVPITLNVDEGVVAFQSDLAAGITTAENFASNAANNAQANAISTAEGYAASQVSTALTTAEGFATTAANNALSQAKTYADSDSNAAIAAADGFAAALLISPQTLLSVGQISSGSTYQIGGADVLKADKSANTVTGLGALLSAALGAVENDAHGASALASLTTGSQNVAHGKEALKKATTASANSALGYQTLLNEISGNNNLAQGLQALMNHTDGDDNTAIGTQAGMNLLKGTKNVLLGKLAGQNLKAAESKEILINNDGVGGESNTIRIGNDIDQLQTYIAGIYQTDHSSNANAVHVLIDKKTGLLGIDAKAAGTSVASISTGSGLLVNGGSGPTVGAATLTVDTNVIATNASVVTAANAALTAAKAYADGDLAAAETFASTAATTAASNAVSSYLPISGGTLTGGLNGTTANFSAVTSTGFVSAPAVISAGPTFKSDGGCGETSLTGGATAGSFTSGTPSSSGPATGTCTLTITMGASIAAPNGWACHANDLTTNAESATWSQTATTTTTATLSGTTASGDIVNFACIGY
jgi:hypothetical protein